MLFLLPLYKECPYSEFFWSVFNPNTEKYGPQKLRIQTLFMQCASERPERTSSSPKELAKRYTGDEVAERHQSSRVVSAFR